MEVRRKQPSARGPSDRFTGQVWIDQIAEGTPTSGLRVGAVHFAPGARTAWHAHAGGQTLYVTEGQGRAKVRGGETVELRPGDVVFTPEGEEHWHGADPEHFLTHLAITEGAATWGAHVTDAEYDA